MQPEGLAKNMQGKHECGWFTLPIEVGRPSSERGTFKSRFSRSSLFAAARRNSELATDAALPSLRLGRIQKRGSLASLAELVELEKYPLLAVSSTTCSLGSSGAGSAFCISCTSCAREVEISEATSLADEDSEHSV